MPEEASIIAEQFEDAEQQYEAANLGMWTFLATEVLFFGGLFLAYVTYRLVYPEGFAAGSAHTLLFYGTLNTAVLLTSSLTMALAVHAAQERQARPLTSYLLVTLALAATFLVVKGFEYSTDIREGLVPGPAFSSELPPQAEIFFYLYWTMTGLHAVHVMVGAGLLTVLAILARRGRFTEGHATPVEIVGLYWHFVDIVWIFLYPLLYLIGRHS